MFQKGINVIFYKEILKFKKIEVTLIFKVKFNNFKWIPNLM